MLDILRQGHNCAGEMNQIAFTYLRGMGPLPARLEKCGGTLVLEQVFSAEGLPVAAAYGNNGDSLVPVRSMIGLFERAARILDDDLFGLRLGMNMAPTDFGPWVKYVLCAQTAGEMIRRSVRTLPYHISSGSFELTIEGPYACWRTTVGGHGGADHRHHTDHLIGPMLSALRAYLGKGWSPAWIEVDYSRPASRHDIEDAFGAPVKFARPTIAIVFPKELLKAPSLRPLRAKDVMSLSDLRHVVQKRLPKSVTEAVQAALSLRLLDGDVDVDGAAQLLGVGVRTLQRQLAEENVAYRDLLEKTRMRRATGLIKETLQPITEIAFSLGYTDLSSFSRVFHKHAGVSPIQLRRARTVNI